MNMPLLSSRLRRHLAVGLIFSATAAVASTSLTIDREGYADRLRGFWAGELLANWTGIRTEHVRPGWGNPRPLYTDADWGTYDPLADRGDHRNGWIDWIFNDPSGRDPYIEYDPWWADDDTDLEYMYLYLLSKYNTTQLTPEQIRDGWLDHIDVDNQGNARYLWVSNENAWRLMGESSQVPPHTGMMALAGDNAVMIDAQLTTEIFGLFAPALPAKALEMADLPIATTADAYAYQAAQFNVLLLSLASAVDSSLPLKDQVQWIMENARHMLPSTSRVAEMYDYIKADYEANSDKDNWERTRNRIQNRYQWQAGNFGFQYRSSVESAINHAAGIMALFYGEGDYRKTVRIGVLAGWDSDNPTASNAGLLGFLMGFEALQAEFPEFSFSDRYNIFRTRRNFPDYLPDDAAANDTLSAMAARMLPLIDRAVEEAGGAVDLDNDEWILPDFDDPSLLQNPRWRHRFASANLSVAGEGGTVEVTSSAGSSGLGAVVDGFEHRFSGAEVDTSSIPHYEGAQVTAAKVEVTYSRPVRVASLRLIQGSAEWSGAGRFTALQWEALVDGDWIPLEGVAPAIEPDWNFQQLDFTLATPILAEGIRLSGPVAGGNLSIFEFDAFGDTPQWQDWFVHHGFGWVYGRPSGTMVGCWLWSYSAESWFFLYEGLYPWVWMSGEGWVYCYLQRGEGWIYFDAVKEWRPFRGVS
jgi:hypothetical protein